MRKSLLITGLLLAGVAALPATSKAQGPRADCYATGTATSTGLQITGSYDNRGLGFNVPCTIWHLIYFASNTTAISICAAYAPDGGNVPGTFACAPTASGLVPLTNITGSSSTVFQFSPWVNVNVSTLTGTGAAVRWQLLGWRPGPGNDSNAQPNAAAPSTVAATQNDVPIAGTALAGVPSNTGFTVNLQPTYGNTWGYINMSTSGQVPAAGSTFVVSCKGSLGTALPGGGTYSVGGLGSVNYIAPPGECPNLQFIFSPGGASTGTMFVDYFFLPYGSTISGVYTHVAGTTATTIKAGPGTVTYVTIGTTATGTVTLFDLLPASCTGTPGTNVVTILTPVVTTDPFTITLNALFVNGICAKSSVAMDYTVVAQ
jgi:hypothetical protein